ncbi:MAG: hypothetical protein K0Q59_4841, partial [Paenibacillus sp.]|nr:hypothetical protein [Paenibacillus sp.]
QRDTFLELAVPGASVSVRLRSGFYPGDTIVDIAFPTQLNERAPIELAFAGSIEAIAKQIRASREAWSRATMVYMCDEPWIPECQEQFCDVSGDRLWEQVSQQFALLFHPYK